MPPKHVRYALTDFMSDHRRNPKFLSVSSLKCLRHESTLSPSVAGLMVVDMLRSAVEDPGLRADTRVGSAELGVKDLNLQPGPLHCIVSCDFDTVVFVLSFVAFVFF